MHPLAFGDLWLQVVAVGVATFFVSALAWNVAPWHKLELAPLPDEEALRQALAAQGITTGQFRVPMSANPAESKTPEFLERFKTGPVGILQLERPGPLAMGRRLGLTFAFFFLVAFFTAYVLRQAFMTGEEYMPIFQLAGSVSFACHFLGNVPDAIWFSKSWRRVGTQAIDSLIYALITAGIFAATWPWA